MKENMLFEFGVTRREVTEWETVETFLGVFSSTAVSSKKAESNIRFKNKFRDHDEGSTAVYFDFQELDPEFPPDDEDALPLYRTINGEECILTDGGTYEVICD